MATEELASNKKRRRIEDNKPTHAKKSKQDQNGRKVFPHGNYPAYYGYRHGGGTMNDPRLSLFQKSWFAGKRVLDIGCNTGQLTAMYVRLLGANKVTGIDIDESLIARAKGLIQREAVPDDLKIAAEMLGVPFVPISFQQSIGPIQTMGMKINYICQDFVKTEDCTPEEYDTILCLSTAKWIHLNNGDEGIKRLFRKIHRMLKPNGIFILESQPWKSYRSKRFLTPEIRANFIAIELKPTDFSKYIKEEIGFASVDQLGTSQAKNIKFGSGKGSARPIWVCKK